MHRRIKLLMLFIFLNSTLCAMDEPDLSEQLRRAIACYDERKALELIAAGAPVNLEPFNPGRSICENDLKLSALQLAAKQGNLTLLRALLKAGASLVVRKVPERIWVSVAKWSHAEEASREKSALMYAADGGDNACVKELVAAKADVHEKDREGNNALIWAVKKGRIGCVRELIAAKSDVNSRVGQAGDMVLMIAIKEKNEACAQQLIAAKAEVSNKQFEDVAGETPLVCAVKHGALGCMRMLIDAKADVNKIADYNVTPLIEAARSGNRAGVRMLLAAGARATAQGDRIDTALDIAALRWDIQTCQLLVEALLKMPNKKQRASIITVFGLIKRKFSGMHSRALHLNREVFFGDLFRRAIEAQNRDNFAESVAGKQVNKLKADSVAQYKMAGNSLSALYGNRGKASKSESKCSIQ